MQQILVERPLPQDGNDKTHARVRSVVVNLAESPLGWLRARGLVSERQFAAGELLRRDYERAALPPRTTMCWDAPPMDHTPRAAHVHGASTHVQIEAKRRFGEAIAAAGTGLADILWRVVCAGEKLPGAERALGWPARAGRLVLTLALDRVADYYRVR